MEVKNKIDDCEYAVKRIPIAVEGRKEHQYEGVLREVKLLAQLDHLHIVRYFNSWVENPPEGWQDKKDKELNIDNDFSSPIQNPLIFDETAPKHKPKLKDKKLKVTFEVKEIQSNNSEDQDIRAVKIAEKLKINPMGNMFNVDDFNQEFSCDSLSSDTDDSINSDVAFQKRDSSFSSCQSLSDNSSTRTFTEEESTLNEGKDSWESDHRASSQQMLLLHHIKKLQDSSSFSEEKDDVKSYLRLINNCLASKLHDKELDFLCDALLCDSLNEKDEKKNWLCYVELFIKQERFVPKILSDKMMKFRTWVLSLMCAIRMIDGHYYKLIKVNLSYILWDLNLIISNPPYSCVNYCKYERQFANIINLSETYGKSSTWLPIKEYNLSLAWPMKRKYINKLYAMVFGKKQQHWNMWKSLFSRYSHNTYVRNLRLMQIWILSMLIYFKSQSGATFSVFLRNLTNILAQLTKALNKEERRVFSNDSPSIIRDSLEMSTSDFLIDSDIKQNLIFYDAQVQKTIKKSMLKKYNKPGYLYIQMQLCQRESFDSWLCSHTEMRNYDEVMKIFLQIVDAVEYVHECGLMHRDLKPSNIYFSKDGLIKIGDFGLATRFETHHDCLDNSYAGDLPFSHTRGIGTPTYLSPEQCIQTVYDSKTDMYSLGLIFYEILYPMRTRFEKQEKLMSARQHMFPSEFIQKYPRECEVIRTLLSYDPTLRPSARELKCHPIFKPFL